MSPDPDQLIPPDHLLAQYAITAEQFANHGPGFVYEVLVKRGNLQPFDKILDLGCGPGHHARALTDYLSREGSFCGLDINKAAIDYCAAAYRTYENFSFQHANIFNGHYNPTSAVRQADYRLPWPDNHFDIAYAVSLFTHLLPEDMAAYFREIERVLKPDGRFIATFFLLTPEAIANIADPAHPASYRFPHALGDCRVMSLENPSAVVAYPETLLRHTLNEYGLRVTETTYGTWNGERDRLRTLQDIVVAIPRRLIDA